VNKALTEGSSIDFSAFFNREQRGIVVAWISLECTACISCDRIKEKPIKFILLESTLWDLSFHEALELSKHLADVRINSLVACFYFLEVLKLPDVIKVRLHKHTQHV
jgi:hypothetical protein